LWSDFEEARPRILGALLDAAVHGLRRLHGVRLDRLPRMADFAIWATACETAFWPSSTFARAYEANRRATVETTIDADPVAACVRDIMAEQSVWAGSAADLMRIGADRNGSSGSVGWPKNPRALAGRLRRAQSFLRALGSTLTSAVRAEPETGLSGSIRLPKLPSAPSAPPATSPTIGWARRNRRQDGRNFAVIGRRRTITSPKPIKGSVLAGRPAFVRHLECPLFLK
jgi:hypothetical protein